MNKPNHEIQSRPGSGYYSSQATVKLQVYNQWQLRGYFKGKFKGKLASLQFKSRDKWLQSCLLVTSILMN